MEGKPTATANIKAVKDVLEEVVDTESTRLIVEPGSAIIGSAVDFHTSVVDSKDTSQSSIVTTDGSRINIDPLWAKDHYTYRVERQKEEKKPVEKQVICGYTCMDHDRIMTLSEEQKLYRGDRIIYEKVGAYSLTFGGPFIRYFPEVYVRQKQSLEKVRKRISVEEYYGMQTL